MGKSLAELLPILGDEGPAGGGQSYDSLFPKKSPGHRRRRVQGPPAPAVDHRNSEAIEPFTSDQGFITKYVQYGQLRTDAPAVAHEVMAVGLLSALAGPGVRLPIATAVKGSALTLWVMYIVDSTSGRKSTVIDQATDIAREVLGSSAVIEWEGSPQGFIQRLQDRDGQPAVFARDEYSGLLQQMNRGGHMAGLPQMFIRAFDGGVLENIRTRKRNSDGDLEEDTDRVEQPYLPKLTASTWGSFMQRATIDNMLDGLLARFIFVTATASPRPLKAATAELHRMHEDLIAHARAVHSRATELDSIEIPNAVLDEHWTLEQAWRGLAEQSARPEAAGPALKRLADAVLKIAALLALERSAIQSPSITPVVSRADLADAIAMGERWMPNTLRVIEALGETTFQRNCDAVCDTVQRHPNGISLSALYGQHRPLRKRDFDEILDALEVQERITKRTAPAKGPGRPPVIIGPGTST